MPACAVPRTNSGLRPGTAFLQGHQQGPARHASGGWESISRRQGLRALFRSRASVTAMAGHSVSFEKLILFFLLKFKLIHQNMAA
jgi:hypothetical protein